MINIYVTNIFEKVKKNNDTLALNNNITTYKCNDFFIGGNRVDMKKSQSIGYTFESYSIVLDGAIYNKKELQSALSVDSTTDEFLIIKAYSSWGLEAFNKINGVFSLVIYDSTRNEVICARDKLGVKPLYYEWNGGDFQICSRLKQISFENKQLSEVAVSAYLSCGYIPSPYTIFEGIKKLQPGCILRIDLHKNTKEIISYWKLAACKKELLNYEEATAKVHELLKDAVKIRIEEDKNFSCFLSGGIDSALVTAIASKLTTKKIKTFTVGFEEAEYDESAVAQQFSDILGTQHNVETLTKDKFIGLLPKFIEAYDEPFADSSALPSLLLNSTAVKNSPIALAGDGGDECFLGYEHFDSVVKFKRLERIPNLVRIIIAAILPSSSRFKAILSIPNEYKFIERIFIGNLDLLKNKNTEWLDTFYSGYKQLSTNGIQKAADLNIQLSLENDSNIKVERASRAYGLQVRSPFLDYRIVELARNLPVEFRFSDGIRKKILRDILEIYIPRDVFEQPKKGFSIPLADWLRTVLKNDIEKQLNDTVLNNIPNLDVKKFKKMMTLHFEKKHDYSAFIWRVYVLVLWKNFNEVE